MHSSISFLSIYFRLSGKSSVAFVVRGGIATYWFLSETRLWLGGGLSTLWGYFSGLGTIRLETAAGELTGDTFTLAFASLTYSDLRLVSSKKVLISTVFSDDDVCYTYICADIILFFPIGNKSSSVISLRN